MKIPIQRNLDHLPKDFHKPINLILNEGFDLVAITIMLGEWGFFLSTKKEAGEAFKYFEKGNNPMKKRMIDGWWYGIEELEETLQYLDRVFNDKPEIFYIRQSGRL